MSKHNSCEALLIIYVVIWNLPMVSVVWIREALQWIFNCWNSDFDGAEEVITDFCLYVSPFPSTMVTARQPHAAALPLSTLSIVHSVDVGRLSLPLAIAR